MFEYDARYILHHILGCCKLREVRQTFALGLGLDPCPCPSLQEFDGASCSAGVGICVGIKPDA